MKVLRFQLLIEAGPADGYSLRVLSPHGEGRGQLVPPLAFTETDRFAAAQDRGDRGDRDLEIRGVSRESPAAYGERLFAAVFQGEVLQLYERSVGVLEGDPEARLRLEIQLDPRDPRLAALQQLPWELLRQPGTSEALALSRRRPLVRYLAVPKPIYAARPPTVLRILAVSAVPCGGLSPLDLRRELRMLRDAVGVPRSGEILEVVEPEAPTLAALRRALLDQECHVLHFMGHGGRVRNQEERVLFFENEAGSTEPVRGTDLVNKLADFPALRLVVLNACHSAVAPEPAAGATFDPFAGVATSLVLGGLAAVVAMRLPISDAAAIAFSRAFYQRLASGDPVDAAVAEGRQALHSASPTGFEWATPVLFMRSPTGELYPDRDVPPDTPLWVRWRVWLAAVLLALALIAGGWYGVRAGRAEYLIAQGETYARHGQWKEARKLFLVAEKLAPDSARLHADLGPVEEKARYYPAAEEDYRRADRLEPHSADHRYALGAFLNRRGRYQEAYDVLASAVALAPSRADVRCELASAALSLGLLDEARANLSEALRTAPERPGVHWLLGELELRSNQPREAIGRLNDAFRRYPAGDAGRTRTKALLVQAYDRSGDRLATCREAGEFRRLDARMATRWALEVEKIAAQRACSLKQ